MTTADLIGYYQGLLILQYRSLTSAVAHVGAWVGRFVQNQIVGQVRDGFNVTTAIGAQLDILGKYRGVPRELFGIVATPDWSLVPYADAAPGSYLGWGVYSDVAAPSWRWLQYNDLDAVGYTLTDTQMRTLIQLRAAFQSWDGSLAALDSILFLYFGTNVTVVDNKDMSMTYNHVAADPDPNHLWSLVVTGGFLPHGAGVSVATQEI